IRVAKLVHFLLKPPVRWFFYNPAGGTVFRGVFMMSRSTTRIKGYHTFAIHYCSATVSIINIMKSEAK
ncbi:hypothetical protein LAY35_25090, partial [Escherichia coli]|nr:hypothetical protein [Escherichia coli]